MDDTDFLKLVKGMPKEELEEKFPFLVELSKIIFNKLNEPAK